MSDTGSANSLSVLADRLISEMTADWHRGERLVVECYLARHPELRGQPEAAVRLVYEEICLRQERGEVISTAELSHRFPTWTEELAVLLDCHELMLSVLAPPLKRTFAHKANLAEERTFHVPQP